MTDLAAPSDQLALSPRAQAIADWVDCRVLWVATHWRATLASWAIMVIGLASLAPLLRAGGLGWLAQPIYLSYRLICHQKAERSYHLHGEKMAFCERDLAIVGGALLICLLWGAARRLPGIGIGVLIATALPMAIDGGTQFFGLRESNWELRTITGVLFSVGLGMYALPHLESGFASLRDATADRLSRAHVSTSAREQRS